MASNPAVASSAGLGRFFVSLARDWRRILVVGLSVTLLAFVSARLVKPKYVGETRILIEAREFERSHAERSGRPSSALDEEGVAGQIEVITSADVLKKVARDLHLFGREEFDAEPTLFDRALILVGLWSDPSALPREERTLRAFRQKLDVHRVERSRVIIIQFSSGDPELAAAVPNALADAYVALQQIARLQFDADAPPRPAPEIADPGERVRSADARIFSRATVPADPYFPRLLPVVGAAFAGSLLAMVIVTLLRELFGARARQSAAHVRAPPVDEVPMPVVNRDEGIGAPPLAKEPELPFPPMHSRRVGAAGLQREPLRRTIGEVDVDRAAESLIAGGAARAIIVSPEGDEGAAAGVLVAREIADAGLRVILLDLTVSGAASRPMLESAVFPGITNLLVSEAQFSDVIHADLYSSCHIVPVGTADATRAMRGAERLPIILESLSTAYDIVIVECGPADAAGISRLVSEDTAILVSAIEPSDAIAQAASRLARLGRPMIVTPGDRLPPMSPDKTAA